MNTIGETVELIPKSAIQRSCLSVVAQLQTRPPTVNMLAAVNRGDGSMAQFSCPELGSGQWMRGGMTMVSDMFNHGLKITVNNLCGELSNALANNQMFPPTKHGSGGNNWWPGNFAEPSNYNTGGNQQQQSNQGSSDIMDLLGNLGKLRDSGVLTDDEFNRKKTELLNRL